MATVLKVALPGGTGMSDDWLSHIAPRVAMWLEHGVERNQVFGVGNCESHGRRVSATF